jgi:hypothetical protein
MYVAITGGVDHPTAVNKDSQTNIHRAKGIQSRGGVLLANQFVRLEDIRDGSTRTMIVAEQSDFCRDTNGKSRDCRSDSNHGFCMGTTPENVTNGDDRWFNTTTVRYPINHRSWNSTGIGDAPFACNRPILSSHPGGALILLAGGSVHFLSDSTELQTVFDLANRDDGTLVEVE